MSTAPVMALDEACHHRPTRKPPPLLLPVAAPLSGWLLCGELVPGTIGQLQDDLVLQVVDLPQPAVIGNVVPVHEGLQTKETRCERCQMTLVSRAPVSLCRTETGRKDLDSLLPGLVSKGPM